MSIKHNLEQWIAQLDYDDTCDISDRQVSELIRGYSDLEAKCAALAAKGMELAAESAAVYGKYNETQMPDRDLVDMQTIQEMHDLCSGVKNADAFLAEVRAKGVEMFAALLTEMDISCTERGALTFATQLRQEAAQ
jgi:hypothetical protein